MSGVKRLSFEEDSARRREALERAERERAAKELNDAKTAGRAAVARCESVLTSLRQAGLANAVASLGLAATDLANETGTCRDTQIIWAKQSALQERTVAAERLACLLDALSTAPQEVTRPLLENLSRAQSLEDAESVAMDWIRRKEEFGAIAVAVKAAERAIAFANQCHAAQLQFDKVSAGSLNTLRGFLSHPLNVALEDVPALAARLVNPEYLAKLELQAATLRSAADVVNSTPGMAKAAEEWRPGLLEELREATREDHVRWMTIAPLLAEFDDFLKTRAEIRIDTLLEAATSAGYSVSPKHWSDNEATWTATMHDAEGYFGVIRETGASWSTILKHMTAVEGPSDFGVEQCMRGGVTKMLEALRRQGVPVSLAVEDEIDGSIDQESPAGQVRAKHRQSKSGGGVLSDE